MMRCIRHSVLRAIVGGLGVGALVSLLIAGAGSTVAHARIEPTATTFPSWPTVISTAAGEVAFVPIVGLGDFTADGGTATIGRIFSAASATVTELPSDGLLVTPPPGFTGIMAAELILVIGAEQRSLTAVVYSGVPLPSAIVWAPPPPPVGIDRFGTAYFDLAAYIPPEVECEISIRPEPAITIVAEPPTTRGFSFDPVPIRVVDDFTGRLVVDYRLVCKANLGFPGSSVDYQLVMYVGVPIPEPPRLADTGAEPAPLLALGVLALSLGLVVSRASRRERI